MLVALAVFSLSSVLRTTVEFFTEQSWSYQYNGVTINQLTSILIWIALPVVSVTLSLMFKVLKGRQHINVGKIMVLLSIVVIPYHVWMIKYIHSKWASTLPDYIQLLLAINILTYFVFTFCQMEFIIANLDCVRDTAVLLRPKWPSILSILYNLAMSIHLLSIVASYGSEIYYRLDLLILLLLEIEHRVVAILTFSRLLWYHIPAGNTQTLPIEIQMADLPFNRTDLAIVRMNGMPSSSCTVACANSYSMRYVYIPVSSSL